MAVSGSRGVVVAALVANAAIAVLKFLAYLLTGSPAMLSETYHSISDTGNQVLLLVGLGFSGRRPSRQHPFGWGKSEFFYGFLVAVLLFGIAGWESLREGLHHLELALDAGAPAGAAEIEPGAAGAAVGEAAARARGASAAAGHEAGAGPGQASFLGFTFSGLWVSYAVLAAAFVFESYALSKAYRAMEKIRERGRYRSLWETFRRAKSAAIITAFTEDLLALVGLVVAAAALALTQATGNPAWDAGGAIAIGCLLMGFALLLAWEQKRLLVGESMDPWQEEEIRAALLDRPEVEDVANLRTVHFGAASVLVAADLHVAADLPSGSVEALVEEVEREIRERFPAVRFVYFETDVAEEG